MGTLHTKQEQNNDAQNKEETKRPLSREERKQRHLVSCPLHSSLATNDTNIFVKHRKKMEFVISGYLDLFRNNISMDLNLYNIITEYISDIIDSKILRWEEIDNLRLLFPSKYSIKYNLLFRASRDGFDVDTFHELCDNKGPTLCIFHSEHQHVFGGFTELKWYKSIHYDHIDGRNCKIETFLFLLRTPIKKDMDNLPIKWTLQKFWKYRSITNTPGSGPMFAWYDFEMKQGCDATSHLGQYFDVGYQIKWPRDTVSLGGAEAFKILDYEVFELSINE
eukprot:101619_1